MTAVTATGLTREAFNSGSRSGGRSRPSGQPVAFRTPDGPYSVLAEFARETGLTVNAYSRRVLLRHVRRKLRYREKRNKET